MAHYVKCLYCGQSFNRDSEEYAIPRPRRHAHAACALRQAEIDGTDPPEIINPKNMVICDYCKKTFDKSKVPFVQRGRKYFHEECKIKDDQREHTDKEKLDDYVMNLFNMDYVSPRIQKQINDYVDTYGYTYSGILYTLQYWIDIKKHAYDTKYDSIGIVPKIYEQARQYKYAIWLAHHQNKDLDMEIYRPRTIEIKIPPPQRNLPKRQLFSFLDEEEVEK